MIQRANVTTVGLKRGGRIFAVAGYEGKLGYAPAHQLRTYKSYAQACKYALRLRDYYQAPVVEF